MTCIQYFSKPFQERNFKKKGNHFYQEYEHGTKFITFDRMVSFDQYYLFLGILYTEIELAFPVRRASSCPLQTELSMITKMRDSNFDKQELTSDIDQAYLDQFLPTIMNSIDEWFATWENPEEVCSFLNRYPEEARDTIVYPQVLRYFKIEPPKREL